MNAPSTFTVAILAIIANGTLLFMIRSQLEAPMLAAARAWLYGTVSLVAGIGAFLVLDYLPAKLELFIPNALLLGGLMGYLVALRLYHRLPIPVWRLAAVMALTLAGVLYFQLAVPDIRVRVFIVSLSWLWAMGDSLRVLYQGRASDSFPAQTALIWLYALVLAGTALRMLYFIFAPVSPDMAVTYDDNLVNRLTPMLAVLLPAAGSSAFMLMCSHHQFHMARQQAVTDPLTGLGNRALLARLSAPDAPAGNQFQAALLIDLNDFKIVNDTYGHAMGDTVLIETARRMRALTSPTDIVIRLGGDEFVILLAGQRSTQAISELVSRLRSALAEPYESVARLVSASVGVAVVDDPLHPPTLQALINQADQAMYLSKRQGGNGAASDAPRA